MPPAPLPILPGVYYARVNATADAKQITNIVAFKKAGVALNDPADAANAAIISASVASRWNGLADLFHVTYTSVSTSCYALGSVLVPAAVTDMVMMGTSPGAEHFKQVAGRIKHTVARRGRGSQHSSYLSPLSAGDITVNGDEVTTAWLTNADAQYPAFIANVIIDAVAGSPGTWTHVQVSKFQNKALTPNSFPVLSSVAQRLISSQRRRLGRG